MSTATATAQGPYRIGSLLGEGAMGRVYAGEKEGYGEVAFKVPLSPEFEDQLLAEADALRKVDHPNIVPYVDWIDHEGGHALVMGFVAGESLEERFTHKPLSQDEINHLVSRMADALAAAHRSGIVHRDLKPSNIMMRPDGEPVVLDFGAAATLDTASADPVGTLSYMSPEQVLGDPASPASDQFSFGVILYEAISGRRPFSGYHSAALEYDICNEDPPPLHEVNQSISVPVSGVVSRLLSKAAEDRFASMEAFLVDWSEAQLAEAGTSAQTRLVISASDFDNETGDDSVAYVGRALLDRVETVLRDVSGVVLVAREAVAAQEKLQVDKLAAAAMVGAGYLVGGRYLVLGDQMQITAEVVDVHDRSTVWSNQYRAANAQLFELQDQISNDLAAHFRSLVPGEEEEVEERTGPDPEAYALYQEARELYWLGGRENLEQAIELCEEAVEKDDTFAVAQACMADCNINMYMWRIDPRPIWLDRGERAAKKALKMNPDTAAAHRSLGRVAQHRRNLDEAVEHFQKAVELDPKYADAMCSLGWISSELKKYDSAIHWASEALKVNQGSREANLLRGLAYMDQRNYAHAERAFRELVRLHPEYSRGHLYLGETLQKAGRFEDAKKAYVAAMECVDFDPEVYRYLGRVQVYLGDLEGARATFMRAIEQEIFEFAAHYYLGLIQRIQGDVTAAQASWQSARLLAERMLAKDPNDQLARLHLGLAKASMGDRSAYEEIQQVRSKELDNGEIAYFEARASQMLGDLDQAEACVFEATQLPTGPSHAEYSADPHFKIDWSL
jgi:tetratricopeptide (TPR) repeat protein